VRNACLILGELKDPELPEHLSAQLRHEDERVQQAAAAVVIKSGWTAARRCWRKACRICVPACWSPCWMS
jgi:hypothetical protein